MKILMVEDEPKTGDYLRQGLSEAGFVVDLAQDGADDANRSDAHVEYSLQSETTATIVAALARSIVNVAEVLELALPGQHNEPISSSAPTAGQ